jgi:hypothetical protein
MTSVTLLTALKLEGPMNIDIFGFLRAAPHLESLELIKLHVHPSPANARSIDLPRLTKLVMANVEYGSLFVRVTFPSLSNLSIDPVEHQEPVEIVWGKLQVPPAVTAVEIEYLAHHRGKLSITGSNKAKTHSLSLTEHATVTRSAPMIQALCHTSLASVTSLSIGRGVPEVGVRLPSTPIRTLISGLPRLGRLDLFPSRFSLLAIEHLRDNPHVCPELKILSLTVVYETCEMVFGALSEFVTDRANSERWLHRIDCVILRVGEDPLETVRVWDSMSRHDAFEGYLRCNGGKKVRQA